jgi:uncharacterized membrane protein
MYVVMWAGGVGSHFFKGRAPADAAWAAPLFLLLAGAMTLMGASRRAALLLALAAGAGLLAEVIGTATGFIFGNYHYTDALGPRVVGVPVVMMSAWMVLVGYVREMLLPFAWPRAAKLLIAAAWMTAIDLLIDPLAAGPLDYWRWLEQGAYYGVPARNFLGWLLVSLLILALVEGFAERGRGANPAAQFVGFSIIIFFALIALAHRMTLAVAVAVSLGAAHLAFSLYSRRRARRANHL